MKPEMLIRSHQFNNGVSVITRPMPGVNGAAVGIWLLNGSRHQLPAQSGFAHLLEHLWFKGTEDLDALTLATRFEMLGGQVNAHTGKELTALHGLAPAADVIELLKLFVAMLMKPRFAEEDVIIERGVVLQEMAMVKDSPEEILEETAAEQVWPSNSLGWPILGQSQVISQVSAVEIRDYLRAITVGTRLWVVVVGDVDHEQIIDASQPLATLSRGSRPKVSTPQFVAARSTLRYGLSQGCMNWLMSAPPIVANDYYPLLVANHILGGGTSSRLFQEVREQRGLAYSIQSRLELYSDTGLWLIQTSCEPDNAEDCRDSVERALEKLTLQGPTLKELEITKRFLKANLLLEQDETESLMERIAREAIYHGRFYSLEERLRLIDAVTQDQVIELLDQAWKNHAYAESVP